MTTKFPAPADAHANPAPPPGNGGQPVAPEEGRASFVERTINRLRNALGDSLGNAGNGSGALLNGGRIDRDLGKKARDVVRDRIEDCITAPGGEVAARTVAANLGRYYLALSETGKRRFLTLLADEFGTDEAAVDSAVKTVNMAQTRSARLDGEARLRRALTPRRMALLTQFNALPDGVKFLVDLRADLLQIASEGPGLAALDDDLKGLLASWFDLGFLDLARITWDSPATLLEKLIAYEAVHKIESWSDLRNRLDSDRRCYALFHPRMRGEPLAFVEVALTRGMADNVQGILDENAPLTDRGGADTAIFYSISNTQRGLKGISFGEYLIKRVVAVLSQELPALKTFATLSPVPGFRVWLEATLLKDPDVVNALTGMDDLAQRIASDDWHMNEDTCATLERPMSLLLGRYFADRRSDGKPIDPVARFHLRNGARLERFNWLGDISPKGLRQAFGFMVNYRYRLSHMDANHEAYERHNEIVASRAVRDLMKKGNGTTRLRRLRKTAPKT